MNYDKKMINRINRIQGQLNGVIKLMEEEKDCKDVITQISASKSSIQRLMGIIISENLIECVKTAEDNGENSEELINEAVNLLVKVIMDISTVIMMLLIGVFGGFISGLVGIGGAIIIYQAILLLPPLFGVPAYSAYTASGLTSSQVFFSTLSGSLKARKKTEFSPPLVIYMSG